MDNLTNNNYTKGIDDAINKRIPIKTFEGEEAELEVKQIMENAKNHDIVKTDINDQNNTEQRPDNESAKDNSHDKIDELNREYAVTFFGNKVCILKEAGSLNAPTQSLSLIRESDFLLYFKNINITVNKDDNSKNVNLGKYWLEHEDRRTYKGIVFNPNKTPEGYYNLWKGFSYKPAAGNCDRYLQHIKEIICNGNQVLYEYLITWMAYAVQKPGDRPEVAIVLRGGQGTGKGTFVHGFGKLFGDHYLQISQSKHLVGNFNSHLMNISVLFADEAFWAGDKQGESTLKAIITEPQLAIEPKGKDLIKVPNRLHLIMASNDDWVIPAGIDERRFAVFDVSEKRKQDTDYFAAIQNQLESGGYEALLDYLLKWDLTKVNLRSIPKTDALLEQKLLSLSPIEKFWNECLWDGLLLPDHDDWNNEIPTDFLYNHFIEFTKKINVRRPEGKAEFGKKMRRMCPSMDNTPLLYRGLDENGFPSDKKRQQYIFQSLEVCRNEFNKYIGFQINWPLILDGGQSTYESLDDKSNNTENDTLPDKKTEIFNEATYNQDVPIYERPTTESNGVTGVDFRMLGITG